MKLKNITLSMFAAVAAAGSVFAQDSGAPKPAGATPTPTPKPVVVRTPPPVAQPTPTAPKLSEALGKTVENLPPADEIPRERREQAYVKLLEGQRYIWNLSRQRGPGSAAGARQARAALQKAVELNPTLAEAYTALAELALSGPPSDIDESISLASLAVRIDRDNFGAHRILSRLYTIKSGIGQNRLSAPNAEKAIGAWKEIARLDPRNAEAWAFLSEFYRRTDKPEERIGALRNWLSAAAPLDPRFYRTMFGGEENLSPENASFKLGEAYFEGGRIAEAVEILNQAVADDPENGALIELFGRAVERADAKTAATAVQALRQAIYASPENNGLIMLLARVQARSGNFADAAKFVNERIAALAEKDKPAAAALQISLGDIYREANRLDEAVNAYRQSLVVVGIDQNNLATDNEREFALAVWDRMIRTYKDAGRFEDAKKTIDGSRKLLGEEDSFADRQMVALYRENGRRAEALQALKFARLRFPDDYGFLRQEASVLAELGRVDEGVAVIRALIGKKKPTVPTLMYDDFTNYLFISSLYSDAKRGKEAVETANQALALARNDEQKQMARLSLATAQQSANDFQGAETTLRDLLKQTPDNPIAQNNLAYFLAERGEKLEEALRMIQTALRSDPENPSFLDTLAWVYFKLGKLELAEENLKKALAFDKSSATIHEHLGDVYQKMGKTEEAKAAWQKALTFASEAQQITTLKTKLGKKAGK